jgi:hypothetical protein
MIQPPLGLLNHLVALRSALYKQSADRAGTKVILNSPSHVNLELLPYAVSEMWHALTSFVCTAHSITKELDKDIPLLPQRLFLPDPERDLLAYSIDAFMNAGARAQDAVLPYLESGLGQSALRGNLPHSFGRVATRLSDYRALGRFAASIESYWQSNGQRLRDYRVLMEHHMLVATEAFLARSDAGIIGLHILLPNNPEVKSQAKLTYNPPEHALPFMEQAFAALVQFADSMTRPLLPISLEPQVYIMVANRIAPIGTPSLFHPIPSIEEISARGKQLAQASVPHPSDDR